VPPDIPNLCAKVDGQMRAAVRRLSALLAAP
jgi:hypothetical protein